MQRFDLSAIHIRMKLLMAALICVLVAGCSLRDAEEVLGSCWNVNDLTTGPVAGQGVFITSMEELSLQAEGCSDRNGANSFELKSAADGAVRNYLLSDNGDRFIGFAFRGHIASIGGRNLLIIEQVSGLRPVQEPQWITDLKRRHAVPK